MTDGKAALVCRREVATEFVWFDTEAEADEAMRVLGPCDADCEGVHTVAFLDGGRIRTRSGPTPQVLIAPIVPGSWRINGSRRDVECPFCGQTHSHSKYHVGTVRASTCQRGFYLIRNLKEDNNDE